MAGAEGFEPPHPVLETGGLPLNLRPFIPSRRRGSCAKQTQLLPSTPTLDFNFSLSGCRLAGEAFTPNQLNRQPLGRVAGALAASMFPHPSLKIVCDSHVERSIVATEYVAEPVFIRLFHILLCPAAPTLRALSAPSGQAGGLPLNLRPFIPSRRRGICANQRQLLPSTPTLDFNFSPSPAAFARRATLLPGARCACGTAGNTFFAPAAHYASSCSWWWNSSVPCNLCTGA